MLDRTKERVAKFEEDHEAVRKVRLHVKKHRAKYSLAVGTGIGVGATIIVMKKFGMPTLANSPSVLASVSHEARATIGDVSESVVTVDLSQHVVQTIVNGGGRCCKIVQDLDNPERLVMKINEVAKELADENNVPFQTARQLLSKHLNGHTDHAYGRHFRIAGVTTVPV